MKKISVILITFILFFFFADISKAIIILPALILIPIIKIVAIIVGGFSIPVVGLTAFLSKLLGRPIKKGLVIGILILIVVGVAVAVTLKLLNPGRSLL